MLSLFLNVQSGTMAALCFNRRICLSYCHEHTYMNLQALVFKKKQQNRLPSFIKPLFIQLIHKNLEHLLSFSAELHKHNRICCTSMDKTRITVQHPNQEIQPTLLTLQNNSLGRAMIGQIRCWVLKAFLASQNGDWHKRIEQGRPVWARGRMKAFYTLAQCRNWDFLC